MTTEPDAMANLRPGGEHEDKVIPASPHCPHIAQLISLKHTLLAFERTEK